MHQIIFGFALGATGFWLGYSMGWKHAQQRELERVRKLTDATRDLRERAERVVDSR